MLDLFKKKPTPEEMDAMGHLARADYEAKYTAERNYEMLMQIYRRAVDANRTRIHC